MSHAKRPSKRMHRACAVPLLGAAGLSLSLASGAPAATEGPAADMPTQNTGMSHEITLGEEEISDVSLATFYVFDKENPGTLGIQLARGGGCGGGGCGGHGGGCGGGVDAPCRGRRLRRRRMRRRRRLRRLFPRRLRRLFPRWLQRVPRRLWRWRLCRGLVGRLRRLRWLRRELLDMDPTWLGLGLLKDTRKSRRKLTREGIVQGRVHQW